MTTLLVGSFTPAIGASGPGLVTLEATVEGQIATINPREVLAAGCPTYATLSPDGRMVYVASEAPMGEIYSFRIGDGALELVEVAKTAPSPAHISVGTIGSSLFAFTSHYWGGCFALHRVLDDGTVSEPTAIIDRNRDKAAAPGHPSRAHSGYFLPGEDFILAADLGFDEILTYGVDEAAGTLTPRAKLQLPAGSGPRHMAFSPDGRVFVAGEREGSVMTILVSDSGATLELVDRRSALAHGSLDGDTPDGNVPAEITLSHGGKFLHVANREVDIITTFRTDGGTLTPVRDTPSGGICPRHIFVDGDYLWVANQKSGTVSAFLIDPDTGILSACEGSSPVVDAAYVRVIPGA
jgi:6-phosphogluconolactonase